MKISEEDRSLDNDSTFVLPIITEVTYGTKRDEQFRVARSLLVARLISLTKTGSQKWQKQPFHSGAFKTTFDNGRGLVVLGMFSGHLAIDIMICDYRNFGTGDSNRFWDDRMPELYEAIEISKLGRSDYSKVLWSCPEEYALAHLS